MLVTPRQLSLPPQVCSKREKRLADPTLEKYVLTVVLDTINAFFSSPFSENSTSLQVSACPGSLGVGNGGYQNVYAYLLVVGKDTAEDVQAYELSMLRNKLPPNLAVYNSKHLLPLSFCGSGIIVRTVP